MTEQAFILQPTYRIERDRPVILLYGTLRSGGSCLIRDARQVPHFFVRQADAARARALGAKVAGPPACGTAMHDGPVLRVEVDRPADVPPLRQRLEAAGIECLEADVRFAYRYLIDRGIRGSIEIEGPWRVGEGVDRVYDDPELRPGEWSPRLSALSVDIETDPTARRLYSIAACGCGVSEVLLLTGKGQDCPASARACGSERELLQAFVALVRRADPDVITGWNVIDFDLDVLARVAARAGVALHLGRGPGPVRLRRADGWRRGSQASLPGRLVLDGIELLRGAFVRFESYALNAVSREVLGKEKTVSGADRAGEIRRMFASDRAALVEYNRRDAELVLEILERLHLLELAVERSRLTGMPPDRVAASIASFDFLYLSELARRRIVAPSVSSRPGAGAPTSGGHVIEPSPGLYANVLVLDFKSLYPSIIRTFQIDPLGLLSDLRPEDDAIVAPNGAAFRREPGILPDLLDELFPRREAARRAGDAVASQAIKILMNSFYGVLGTAACRFASPKLANAITSYGRQILLWTKSRIEAIGHRVLYGDTDSLFVLSGSDDPASAERLGASLVEQLNRELAQHVLRVWGVSSRLELEFERLYLKLLLPVVRHGSGGARKRYAGLVRDDAGTRVVFTGLEVVRRDWTQLAKRVQRELYERLFTDRPVADYLRSVVQQLRAGQLDDLLVYRKSLRKEPRAYTASTPPHVAAARKMRGTPGRVIRYVVTSQGPEPAEERASPIDHEHYVQKQVRPVAEPVLGLMGLDFDRVIGDASQLSLF